MDLITHTIVGTATYRVFTGQELSFEDPFLIATMVGASLPDIDIVTHLFGDVPYFKYHRGATHSILGTIILSLLVGGGLSFIFDASFFALFSFTLLGCATHVMLDTLNSYGAQLFWPFSHKRTTLNLLVFIEPFMVALLLAVIMFNSFIDGGRAILLFILVLLYLLFRYLSKLMLKRMLKKKFSKQSFDKVVIVPAFASIFHWDYILENNKEVILGRTTLMLKDFEVKKRLKKEAPSKIVKKALLTKVGKFFADFTPHYYIKHEKIKDKHLVKFIDLRYLVKEGFVNSAEVILSDKGKVMEAFFQPYSENRKIPIN